MAFWGNQYCFTFGSNTYASQAPPLSLQVASWQQCQNLLIEQNQLRDTLKQRDQDSADLRGSLVTEQTLRRTAEAKIETSADKAIRARAY